MTENKLVTEPEQLRLIADPPVPEIVAPTRTEVTVLGADPPSTKKLGWSCYELVLGTPEWEEHQKRYDPTRLEATDEADKYKVYHHREVDKLEAYGWTSIPVLEFLNGRPWNNAALNTVHALRPSTIRVSTGCVTADAWSWRVTVILEDDERTIKRITQEVQVGLHGCRNGWDVSMYIAGVTPPERQPSCIINPRAIAKLHLGDK
jgi:hypothetical protein